MFFGGIGRAKAEFCCNFRPRRREAGVFDGILDEIEDLFLAGGQFEHGVGGSWNYAGCINSLYFYTVVWALSMCQP